MYLETLATIYVVISVAYFIHAIYINDVSSKDRTEQRILKDNIETLTSNCKALRMENDILRSAFDKVLKELNEKTKTT